MNTILPLISFWLIFSPITLKPEHPNQQKSDSPKSFDQQISNYIQFDPQNINTNSTVRFFTVKGLNLTGNVTIFTTAPFALSKDSVVYQTSISYTLEELASLKKVYVRFRPTFAGSYTETVTNMSEGAEEKFLTLTGTAIDPNSENDHTIVANNIITPNGDGKNDYWTIRNIEYYPASTVTVFDHSGHVVYAKKGYTNDWNGTYNSQPLLQGTYYYVIDCGNGQSPTKGFITVVRDLF